MRILFIGDIFGRAGREALQEHLPALKARYTPDIVITNGENSANGFGITEKICKQFYEWGVDVITTGNHVWDQREILPYITRDKNLLRPMNYPKGAPGLGGSTYQIGNGQKITVVNMMARLFMDQLDDPFQMIQNFLSSNQLGKTTDAIFIDFHGEATSEKYCFAHLVDGRVSAVVGTHTHVPTADYHIMEGGTAYQTDAGMTGDYNSSIGLDKELAVQRFLRKIPGERPRPAKGQATLCGTFIETNDRTGLAKSIQPVRVGGMLSERLQAEG